MVVIAVWGMETLKNLDTISVPLLLLIMIVGTVMAFRIYGTAGLSANEVETPTMSMIEGIGTAFSFFSASALTAADLTRFQRNRRDTVKSAVWGLMPAGIITCVIGVLLSRVVGVYDISQVMAMVGLPILGLTIMILAQLTTNSVNAYTGGLDAVMTFNLPDNRRREATFVVGVLGVVLAVLRILDFIEVYLNWTTFLGAPIAGVMIADYWIVGRGKPASWHPNDGWNRTGIAATLISLMTGLPTLDADAAGRAVPGLDTLLSHINGGATSPLAMADDNGNITHIRCADPHDAVMAQNIASPIARAFHSNAGIAGWIMGRDEIQARIPTGTISLAKAIGEVIQQARQTAVCAIFTAPWTPAAWCKRNVFANARRCAPLPRILRMASTLARM